MFLLEGGEEGEEESSTVMRREKILEKKDICAEDE